MRGTWATWMGLVVAAASAIGCGGDDGGTGLFQPTGGPPLAACVGAGGATASASSSATSGEGGASSSTASSSSVSASSATSSSSSTGVPACVPLVDACKGAVCGSVDDGCGKQALCGNCQGVSTCRKGACCYPSASACDGRCDVDVPDGCGGMVHCDGQCGVPSSGLMHCAAGGVCACKPTVGTPAEDWAKSGCNGGSPPWISLGAFCGEKNVDTPKTCAEDGNLFDGMSLWCCD